MANVTGGTAAPNVRMNAAARVLGAPARGTPQKTTPGQPRLPSQRGAQGRGITQHQTAPQQPVQQRQQARQNAVRAAQREAGQDNREAAQHRPATAGQPTGLNPYQEYATGKYLDPAQLQAIAKTSTTASEKAALAPLRQQGKEIGGAEGVALQRQASMGATSQQQLAGLAQGEEASAKTAQNNAAEAAVSAAKEINTSGQSAQTANGGFLDPAVQQALAASSNTAGALGGAASQYAGAMGVSGANLMANLRASAAQRVTEGASRIAQGYGAAQQGVTNREGAITAARPATEGKALNELGKQQVADQVALKNVGIKEGTLATTAANDQARNRLTARGQNMATSRNQANVNQRETASQRTASLGAQKQSFAEWSTTEKLAISKLSATDKARYDQAQIRVKEAATQHKAVTPKEGRTYMSKLSTAEQIARGVLGSEPKSKTAQERARAELVKKGASGDVVSAALNLAVYGRLGTADEAAAISYGLTKGIRPQWFR
jgi:hypothetical protein